MEQQRERRLEINTRTFRTKRKCRNHKHLQGSVLRSDLEPKIYTSVTLTEAEPGRETLTETTKGQTRRTPARWTSISDPGRRPGSRPWCELPGTSWRRRPYSCKDYRRPVTHRVQCDDKHCQTAAAITNRVRATVDVEWQLKERNRQKQRRAHQAAAKYTSQEVHTFQMKTRLICFTILVMLTKMDREYEEINWCDHH